MRRSGDLKYILTSTPAVNSSETVPLISVAKEWRPQVHSHIHIELDWLTARWSKAPRGGLLTAHSAQTQFKICETYGRGGGGGGEGGGARYDYFASLFAWTCTQAPPPPPQLTQAEPPLPWVGPLLSFLFSSLVNSPQAKLTQAKTPPDLSSVLVFLPFVWQVAVWHVLAGAEGEGNWSKFYCEGMLCKCFPIPQKPKGSTVLFLIGVLPSLDVVESVCVCGGGGA